MDISDSLRCVFSARVDERQDSYLIEVPKHEITNGTLIPGEVYRTALLSTSTDSRADDRSTGSQPTTEADSDPREEQDASGLPVQEGDVRDVDIADLGDEGDGIARVEHGYVIIVPEGQHHGGYNKRGLSPSKAIRECSISFLLI